MALARKGEAPIEPTVFLAPASQRYFPDDEDGRRLFYVALTEAPRGGPSSPDNDSSPLKVSVKRGEPHFVAGVSSACCSCSV